MATKKVRVTNSTSDVPIIRVYINHFNPNLRWITNVSQGAMTQNNHVTAASRGLVVFEDFNEKVIATDVLELDPAGLNIHVFVHGDATGGYTISKAVFDD